MPYDIGPRIGIDGETEFRRELREINSDLKVLGSQMKVVTSEFIGSENSMEALTAQNYQLEESAAALESKIEILGRRLQDYADAGQLGSESAKKLQIEMNKATAQLNKTRSTAAQNSRTMQELSANSEKNVTVMGQLGDILGNKVSSSLGVSKEALSGLTSSLLQGGTAMEGFASKAMLAIPGMTLFLKALLDITKALVGYANEGGKYADEILTTATNYGIATNKLQQYQYMAELTDTSVDTITGSMSKLTRTMNEARDGTGSAAEAFAKLNISVTDGSGQLRSTDEVFGLAIDKLGQVGNATERDALAMEIFGRSAQDLNSLIAVGADGIAAYAAEAENTGYVLSDKMLSALGEVDDSTVRLDNSFTALHNTLGAAVAPAVSTTKNAIADLVGGMADAIQTIFKLKDANDDLARSMGGSSGGGVRNAIDVDPDAFLTQQQKYERMIDQRRENMAYEAQYGNRVTTSLVSRPIEVSVNIDGQVAGRAMTPYVEAEQQRRGRAAVK